MRLATPGKILFFVLLFLPAEQTFTQSASQATESQNCVSAEMSFQEFSRGLAPWLRKHPELFTKVNSGSQVIARSQFPHDQSVSRMYRMKFPTLDIYSSAGESFYYSDSSDINVKLLDALPRIIPEPDLDPRYKARPSLREVLSMIPGITRNDWTTPAQFEYTIVAVMMTYTGDTPLQSKDAGAGHAKNKAIYQQNMNGSGTSIRAIEVPDSPEEAQRKALANKANAPANQAQDEAIQRLKTRLNGSRIRVIEIHLTQH